MPIHKDIRAYNASQSAFEPVWQVLKALRVHDCRLADELDQLRLSLDGDCLRHFRHYNPAFKFEV